MNRRYYLLPFYASAQFLVIKRSHANEQSGSQQMDRDPIISIEMVSSRELGQHKKTARGNSSQSPSLRFCAPELLHHGHYSQEVKI